MSDFLLQHFDYHRDQELVGFSTGSFNRYDMNLSIDQLIHDTPFFAIDSIRFKYTLLFLGIFFQINEESVVGIRHLLNRAIMPCHIIVAAVYNTKWLHMKCAIISLI